MPVRLRITLLFALLVFIILSIVCTGIYYFSYTARLDTIKKRLTNRAITTARLLSQKEIFSQRLVQRIDSLTTISLTNKTVQAYDYKNNKIYNYSDLPGDTLNISNDILDDTRFKGNIYFSVRNKEAIAFHYVDNKSRIVIISAGEDEDGQETLSRLLKILVISFLIGNIFVLAVGYLFSRGLLQPIRKITDDVAEISAQNLARRIQTGQTKDEWYHLSHTLNDLLDRLQESFELQRRFISNASHELSTPLTSISSQLEVSLQKERVAEDYKKVMQSIYQDVRHMSNLTQTLLEFAKASGNTGGLEINLVRMDEIILQLPAEIVKINNAYSIILQFDDLPEDEENLLVFGNETLLLTAIKNIVVNACKYSENHQATVHLKMQDQSILIIIEDQGAGIPKEELAKIFQPFYRVEEHRTTGGFGLGLSLAERIIKLHKGTIEVASEKGKGTTFYISLPPARNLGSI
jgi:signal transduction histidine kinase